ncbi:integrin-linked kinase-associated serine/threonine phosphatase 2C-like [Corticium candelabrum]|uniref:integrin-linked kinase-associated serine/threonine phosphatase 2C-like n=1 Tax=Corticium candelabrum TaxID=121492 RepID=UPI002E25C5E3|nr:integrin-linked kinase-associated serine/threonine phosphatase 2C-like [Corticium candelabrum]
MDLFDDLPPPADNVGKSLFDDLPQPAEVKEKKREKTIGELENERQDYEREKEVEVNGESAAKRKKVEEVRYRLVGAVGERRGEREDMQDSHQMRERFTDSFIDLSSSITRIGYYGLFDGHAGSRASRFAADKLHEHIVAKFPKGEITNLDREVKKCLVDAFRTTDDEFLAKATAASPTWKDGCTAVVLLLVNDTVYVVNLGDSKALLCKENGDGTTTVKRLTKDHNPVLYEERMRIQKAGGLVRDGRVMGVIEVSRSIGDGRFKHCGVTCVPDVSKFDITTNDRFILIACDGLFKAFSADAAVKRVCELLKDPDLSLPSHMKSEDYQSEDERAARHEAVCHILAEEAVRKFSADNVSVMLVDIREKQRIE